MHRALFAGLAFFPAQECSVGGVGSARLYKLLALVDGLRGGRARECDLADRELKKRLGLLFMLNPNLELLRTQRPCSERKDARSAELFILPLNISAMMSCSSNSDKAEFTSLPEFCPGK